MANNQPRTYRLVFFGDSYGTFTVGGNPSQLITVTPVNEAARGVIENWVGSAISRHIDIIEYLDNYPKSGYWSVLPVPQSQTGG